MIGLWKWTFRCFNHHYYFSGLCYMLRYPMPRCVETCSLLLAMHRILCLVSIYNCYCCDHPVSKTKGNLWCSWNKVISFSRLKPSFLTLPLLILLLFLPWMNGWRRLNSFDVRYLCGFCLCLSSCCCFNSSSLVMISLASCLYRFLEALVSGVRVSEILVIEACSSASWLVCF